MLHLYIGNKNYSSWSMRPWVLLRHFDIPFTEHKVSFEGGFGADSPFKKTMSALSPTAIVPLLIDDATQLAGKPLVVWDTLAIVEYAADYCVQHHLQNQIWPQNAALRARARSLCAEMHAGFSALRSSCMMNIEASLPEAGALALRDKPAVKANLDRINAMWLECLQHSGGPFLMGAFSAVDAYFAPVVMRINTYALPVHTEVAAYCQRVTQAKGIADWIADALAEKAFLDFEEPYRLTAA